MQYTRRTRRTRRTIRTRRTRQTKRKHTTYKRRKIQKQKQRGGDVSILEEAKRLFHLAEAMDEGSHTFFLAGSVALLFHAAAKGIHVNYKPTDLDIRYKELGALFVAHVQQRTTQAKASSSPSPLGFLSLQTSFSTDIDTCPEYVDFDVYRACAPILDDVTFIKRDTSMKPMFDSVDFTQVSRRNGPSNTIVLDGIRVLDVAGLKNLYTVYGGTNSAWKLELLKQLA